MIFLSGRAEGDRRRAHDRGGEGEVRPCATEFSYWLVEPPKANAKFTYFFSPLGLKVHNRIFEGDQHTAPGAGAPFPPSCPPLSPCTHFPKVSHHFHKAHGRMWCSRSGRRPSPGSGHQHRRSDRARRRFVHRSSKKCLHQGKMRIGFGSSFEFANRFQSKSFQWIVAQTVSGITSVFFSLPNFLLFHHLCIFFHLQILQIQNPKNNCQPTNQQL